MKKRLTLNNALDPTGQGQEICANAIAVGLGHGSHDELTSGQKALQLVHVPDRQVYVERYRRTNQKEAKTRHHAATS